MSSILYILNISKDPRFTAAANLMTEIMTVSRLNYKPDLIKMKNVCPLPAIPSTFNTSFEEVCILRSESIWKEKSRDKSINIFWSGGIDSTAALVGLIKTQPSKHAIRVYCNLNSILENNYFYKLILKNENTYLYNSSLINTPEKMTMITGELGDQVFGSDLLFRISSLLGFDNLFSPYMDVIPKLFASKCGAEQSDYLYQRYEPIVAECPFKISTAFDFVWWWNFTQKWQCVKYRKHSLVNPNINPIHFFESDDFQLWSLFNHEKKIGTKIETYKMPAKEFIYSFDKNNTYMEKKKKYGSPFGNKRHFYALLEDGTKINTWSDCNYLIEQNKLI